MRKIVLGRAGIEVAELCFGALPIGPLQKDIPLEEGSETIVHALESGVNFVDTAQMYKTYPYIKLAIEKSGITPVISSKSTAVSYEDMQKAVEEALEQLGVQKLDIFLLHAARVSHEVLEERKEALRCLVDYRNKGIIKAVGISTHVVEVVRRSAAHPDIDIVFPIINERGLGVLEGTREDMEQAINACHTAGKGVFLMKVLGGGNMIADYKSSMEYAIKFSAGRFPIAMGMLDKQEVDMNIKCLRGEDISAELADAKMDSKSVIVFKPICVACQKCIDACHSSAIAIDGEKAKIDDQKCLRCGYCVDICPRFAIRMV